ncbi:MAG: hypothetical protein RMJ88_09460 [Thermogemmata sp.]|nr:hypothetical protein [Thermogemmata sp.]
MVSDSLGQAVAPDRDDDASPAATPGSAFWLGHTERITDQDYRSPADNHFVGQIEQRTEC